MFKFPLKKSKSQEGGASSPPASPTGKPGNGANGKSAVTFVDGKAPLLTTPSGRRLSATTRPGDEFGFYISYNQTEATRDKVQLFKFGFEGFLKDQGNPPCWKGREEIFLDLEDLYDIRDFKETCEKSTVMLLFLSSNTFKRVAIWYEILIGLNQNRPIIPIVLEGLSEETRFDYDASLSFLQQEDVLTKLAQEPGNQKNMDIMFTDFDVVIKQEHVREMEKFLSCVIADKFSFSTKKVKDNDLFRKMCNHATKQFQRKREARRPSQAAIRPGAKQELLDKAENERRAKEEAEALQQKKRLEEQQRLEEEHRRLAELRKKEDEERQRRLEEEQRERAEREEREAREARERAEEKKRLLKEKKKKAASLKEAERQEEDRRIAEQEFQRMLEEREQRLEAERIQRIEQRRREQLAREAREREERERQAQLDYERARAAQLRFAITRDFEDTDEEFYEDEDDAKPVPRDLVEVPWTAPVRSLHHFHPMLRFKEIMRNSTRFCDLCKVIITEGGQVLRCNRCQFDICSRCEKLTPAQVQAEQKERESEPNDLQRISGSAVTHRSPHHQHPMPRFREIVRNPTRFCNVCRSTLSSLATVLHCNQCDYDVCSRCEKLTPAQALKEKEQRERDEAIHARSGRPMGGFSMFDDDHDPFGGFGRHPGFPMMVASRRF